MHKSFSSSRLISVVFQSPKRSLRSTHHCHFSNSAPARASVSTSTIIMPPKRKTTDAATNGTENDTAKSTTNGTASKKQKKESSGHPEYLHPEFYPNGEITNARSRAYIEGKLTRPIDLLQDTISSTSSKRHAIKPGKAVLFWYKRDIRLKDNRGLHEASEFAKKHGLSLITLYIVSPEDLVAHFDSPARVDFVFRTLHVLQKDLDSLDIPLIVETVEKRKEVGNHIISFCQKHSISHVFANIEYEVNELRREASLIKSALTQNISVSLYHDALVVPPGLLTTGQGKQYAVYTPWYRSWMRHIHENPNLLDEHAKPLKNPSSVRKDFSSLFNKSIPSPPKAKALSADQAKKFKSLYPPGEHEAASRLSKFIDQAIRSYSQQRNLPAVAGTSNLSVHFATGTLSARTAVSAARSANSTRKLDSGHDGIRVWISEVAWREFYKHVMCAWPHVCMFKPFKLEYAGMRWEHNQAHLDAWKAGRTGFPIVDAAMRQLADTAYMHNRCRMIVASFLSKDLLLDWRAGEAYFHETLVDGDFASNNGGWGFSASVGVDPQPYFRIFNPLLQSEKFDPDGEYIRKWVPELRDVQGKAIHDPYGRGAEKIASKNGYPKPIVDHAKARPKALDRYKSMK